LLGIDISRDILRFAYTLFSVTSLFAFSESATGCSHSGYGTLLNGYISWIRGRKLFYYYYYFSDTHVTLATWFPRSQVRITLRTCIFLCVFVVPILPHSFISLLVPWMNESVITLSQGFPNCAPRSTSAPREGSKCSAKKRLIPIFFIFWPLLRKKQRLNIEEFIICIQI
jgi:hypothetical protein